MPLNTWFCEYVITKGARLGQPCGRRAQNVAEDSARCLCKVHARFPLGMLPVLVLHKIASYVEDVDIMLALPRVSKSLHSATSDPVLWDRFYAQHAQVSSSASSAEAFGLTARQKLRLARADASGGPWTCEWCSAAVNFFPWIIPCCLCPYCATNRIFIARAF